jgi:uncharacterized protein DUF3800
LPRIVEFLGLPEAKRGTLVPVQAWIDDSAGGKGSRRMFVLGGLVHEAEWWANFSQEWMKWCDVRPRLPYLKMDQLHHLCQGWGDEQKIEKLRGFLKIIYTDPLPFMTYFSLDLDRFERNGKSIYVPPANDPFFMPAYSIVASVAYEQARRKPGEQCEVIFDAQDIFGPRFQLLYPELRDGLLKGNPILETLPHLVRFENDKEYPPLQAADLLVWMIRHSESHEPHEYEFIQEGILRTLPRCQYFGELRNPSPMTEEDRQNMLPPEVFEEVLSRLRTRKLGNRYARYLKENYEKNRI